MSEIEKNIIKDMKLPSREYIRTELFDKYVVLSSIRRHCEKVRDVGEILANGLHDNGVQIDLNLVDRGCLVHDVMKAVTLPRLVANPEFDYVPSDREIEAQTMLKERYAGLHETLIVADLLRPSFPEFSDFVINIGTIGNTTYLDGGIELKVVHYADWRVQFDRIVPFRDRLQYLKNTYSHKHPEWEDEWWKATIKKELALEKEIFTHLSFEPDDLAGVIAKK